MAKKAPPPKKKMGILSWVFLIIIVIALIKACGNMNLTKPSKGETNSSAVTLSSYQACVISREDSTENPQQWNYQGAPYWGDYQFGKALWTGAGDQSASSWGNASASIQTQAFYNVMRDPAGCWNWYPSDGCVYPQGGCG